MGPRRLVPAPSGHLDRDAATRSRRAVAATDPDGEELGLADEPFDLELPAGELDDALAEDGADLDFGSILALDPEDAQPDDEGTTFDYAALLATTTDEGGADDDDGPDGLDLAAEVTPGPDLADAPDDEPTGHDEDLAATPLPELDADEEGFTDVAVPELAPSARDEARPPWSENPWGWELTRQGEHPCTAVATGVDAVAAAGHGVLWLVTPRAAPERALADARVTSLALVGPAPTMALAVTAGGPVLRVGRDGAVTRCEGWRAAAGVTGSTATLELCTLAGGLTAAVIARASNGALLRSDDAGQRWKRLDLGGKVVALSGGTDSPLALVRTATGMLLARGSHDGSNWIGRPFPPLAAPLCAGEGPLIAGVDSCVLVSNAELGVALSTDGGANFRHLPGLAGATALAVGRLAGRPAAWLALYAEADEATDLVFLDLDQERPLRVARMSASDPEARGARLVALAWDDEGGRLWAAGEIGVGAFSPPRQ